MRAEDYTNEEKQRETSFIKRLLHGRTGRKMRTSEIVLLCILLAVLVWLFISMGRDNSTGGGADDAQQTDAAQQTNAEVQIGNSGTQTVEQRLADSLSLIKGAGKVRVFLTYEEAYEPTFEELYGTSDASDEAAEGEIVPQIRGVLVVAEGGGDIAVADKLLRAVSKSLNVEYSKIEIMEMEGIE